MVRSNGKTVSIRELARRLKVSDKAVRNGIRNERLKESLGADAKGRPVVNDVDRAIEEWKSNAPPRSVLRKALSAPESACESAPESATEARRRTLDDFRVDRDNGVMTLAINVSDAPDSEDPQDWFGIGMARDVAANLGLALWCRAGMQVEDLPGMKRHRPALELAATLRAASTRLENEAPGRRN
jgi:hypothetical protein